LTREHQMHEADAGGQRTYAVRRQPPLASFWRLVEDGAPLPGARDSSQDTFASIQASG
jgi:hypothetical protein